MQVHTSSGRTVDLEGNYIRGGTIGTLADGVADDTYGLGHNLDGRQFSFKVDGVVFHPDTDEASVGLRDDSVVELVEVTDYDFDAAARNADGIELPLNETGELVVPNADGTVPDGEQITQLPEGEHATADDLDPIKD